MNTAVWMFEERRKAEEAHAKGKKYYPTQEAADVQNWDGRSPLSG